MSSASTAASASAASVAAEGVHEESKTLRVYKLLIEYKQLAHIAPRGVYVLPSFDDMFLWHGVIFVRRGHYGGGIFKFRYQLPPTYPSIGSRPSVVFTSRVYHPLVHPDSGELELHNAFPNWDPTQHFNVSVLTFIKKIFYLRDFHVEFPYNAAANDTWRDDKRAFLDEANRCVQESLEQRHENEPGSSIRMMPPVPQHDQLRIRLTSAVASDTGAGAKLDAQLAAVVGAGDGPPAASTPAPLPGPGPTATATTAKQQPLDLLQ